MSVERQSREYRDRWDTLVAELRANSRVTLVEAALGRPLPEAVILEDARARGLVITDDLVALYRFANWVRLEWHVGEDWRHAGKIGIPSLELAAVPPLWRGFGAPKDALTRSFAAYGVTVDEAFERVTPIDFFARSVDNIELAGLFVNRGALDVFVTEGDLSCLTDTHLVSLGEYVDLLLRSYGAPGARSALNGGAAEQPRASVAIPGVLTKTFQLDELIEFSLVEHDVEATRQFFRGRAAEGQSANPG